MKQLIFIISLLVPVFISARDNTIRKLRIETEKTIKKDPNDTSSRTWKAGGLYSLNLSQGSLSNWAAGGDKFSLAVNSLFSVYAFYKKRKHSWDNTFDFNLGYVNTTSLGSRKNDDRFDLLSKYGLTLSPKLNAATLFNFRSQLFKGYTYPNNIKTYSSDFMAPGYLLLSMGLDYKPVKNFSVFFSPVTARLVIVNDTALSNKGLYGVDTAKSTNLEFGAFASINYIKEFNKILTYKGRLDLFSNYKHNPQNVDIYMTNALNVKLTKALAFTWSVDLIYDDDVRLFGDKQTSPALQLKSLVGIGLLMKF